MIERELFKKGYKRLIHPELTNLYFNADVIHSLFQIRNLLHSANPSFQKVCFSSYLPVHREFISRCMHPGNACWC